MPEPIVKLPSFERNKFYYGKLLDEAALSGEQAYFNKKRQLINRLVFGSGVVLGLDVRTHTTDGGLTVYPGVAIDAVGREIVLSETVTLSSEDLEGIGTNEARDLCLAYREDGKDAVPMYATGCDSRNNCACDRLLESGRVFLKEVPAPNGEPAHTSCSLDEFPAEDALGRHRLILDRIRNSPANLVLTPQEACIRIARVSRNGGDGTVVEPHTGTSLVPSNPLLGYGLKIM